MGGSKTNHMNFFMLCVYNQIIPFLHAFLKQRQRFYLFEKKATHKLAECEEGPRWEKLQKLKKMFVATT